MEASQEYQERSKLQERDLEIAEAKHRLKMEELSYERETNKLFHDWALERGRINRAEERKDYQAKRSFGRRD